MNLARSSRRFYGLFKQDGGYLLALQLLNKLLGHAALGELEQAEEIWRSYPDLVSCKGTIYHPKKTYVEGQSAVDIPFLKNPGRYLYRKRSFYQILLMNSEFEEAEKVGKLMCPDQMKIQSMKYFQTKK